MSGDRPPLAIRADPGSVLARSIQALDHFPTDQPWVLVGGIAVFLRLGAISRPTADADMVARSQAALLAGLTPDGAATVISAGHVNVEVGDGTIQVDVMDLNDDPLPGDHDRRAFALARRSALDTARTESIVVSDPTGAVIAGADIPVATPGSLVALKTVSMIRRPHGNHPAKVGSDIHDLVRLVTTTGARALALDLAAGDPELATWVAEQIARAFGPDLRYTLHRLRANDRSPGAQSLTDADIAATVILGDALHEQLAERDSGTDR